MWNGTHRSYESPVHLLPLFLLYGLVMLTGIVGNVSLLVALASSGAHRLRTPQLLSACAADLLVCALSAPLAMCRAAALSLPCALHHTMQVLPVTASILSLVALSVDRWAAVKRGRGTPSCAPPCVVVLGIWSVGALLAGIAAVAHCAYLPPLAALQAILSYCLPALIVTRCHYVVKARLTALSLTARAAHGELPLPVPLMRRPTHVIIVAGVAGPERRERRDAVDAGDRRKIKKWQAQPSLLGPQPQMSTLRSRRRLGNILVGVAAIFMVCWCPHAFIVILEATGMVVPKTLAQYMLLLGHAHSAINALTYWVLNRHALTAACATWRLPQLRAREERASSTNEAALGAFHPRLARQAPPPKPPPSSFLF